MRTGFDQQGLTLIEVLTAGTILSVGLLGFLTVFPTGYLNIVATGGQAKAAAYAQQTMELLKSTPFPSADALPVLGSDSLEEGQYQRTWKVAPVEGIQPPSRLLSITVTVRWGGRRPGNITLETMRTE